MPISRKQDAPYPAALSEVLTKELHRQGITIKTLLLIGRMQSSSEQDIATAQEIVHTANLPLLESLEGLDVRRDMIYFFLIEDRGGFCYIAAVYDPVELYDNPSLLAISRKDS